MGVYTHISLLRYQWNKHCEWKHRQAAESYQVRETQRISSEHFSQISVTRKYFYETNEKNCRDKTNEQPNDAHDKDEVKNQQDGRVSQSCWQSAICAIVGDSMLNGVYEKRLSQKYGNVKELKILIIISSKTNQITWSCT